VTVYKFRKGSKFDNFIQKFLFRLFLKRGLDASDRFHDSLIMNNVLLLYNTTQTSSFDRIMYCPTADVTQ